MPFSLDHTVRLHARIDDSWHTCSGVLYAFQFRLPFVACGIGMLVAAGVAFSLLEVHTRIEPFHLAVFIRLRLLAIVCYGIFMHETLIPEAALRPTNLVRPEEQEASLQATLLEQQQSAETAERTTFLRRAGALAMKAAGIVENTITKAAIYTQMNVWNISERVSDTVAHTKDYLKLQGGRAVAHGYLAVLALGGSAGFMSLEGSNTAYAAATNTISYTINPDTAAGGVFARTDPHTTDSPRTPGYGVYPGETVDLLCGVTDGDPVGRYNNTTWHFVRDENNPGEGNFWLNDHYVNSPNAPSQLAPGEASCANESSDPMAIVSAPVPPQASSPNTPNFNAECATNSGTVAINSLDSALAGLGVEDDGKILGASYFEKWQEMLGADANADDICIGTQLSAPDYTNHRQYVGNVISAAPDVDPAGCDAATEIEIWGDGFYKKTNCTDPTAWIINKWLRAGTYVCAAISTAQDTGYYKDEADADKAAEEGRVKLGSADPYREITCFEVQG